MKCLYKLRIKLFNKKRNLIYTCKSYIVRYRHTNVDKKLNSLIIFTMGGGAIILKNALIYSYLIVLFLSLSLSRYFSIRLRNWEAQVFH